MLIFEKSIKKQSKLYAIWLIGFPTPLITEPIPGGTYN